MTVGPSRVERHELLMVATLGAVFLAYVGLTLAAAADAAVVYTLTFIAVLGLEYVTERVVPALGQLLRAGQFGPEARGLAQTLTFGLLVVRHFPDWGTGRLVVVIAVLACLPLSRAAYLLVLFGLRGRLVRPLETRNIDLGPLSTTPPVPALLTGQVERRLVHLGSIPLLAGALGLLADQLWPFIVLAVSYTLALMTGAGIIVFRVVGRRGQPTNAVWERRVLERIRAMNPEVILYFSGSTDAAYQLNMWLKPLADLERPALVMLRERHVLNSLAPTELPVVCMPDAITVMQAKLTSARVALYAAHTSKNIHLLREPGIRHVFIGHGDSDKVSSINPFAKAYDEVWVAGRAGRDRWASARVGVRDEAVVEVGRPQLEAVTRATSRGPNAALTVLYAPTWEGWTDEDFGSSITHMGPPLVRALLAADPPVRIIYKPHPFTGLRDKRARRAHAAIVRMLDEANNAFSTAERGTELAAIERRLDRPGLRPVQDERLSRDWSEHFWANQPGGRHVVVDETRPTLVDCFNHADVLIADVSSVVSDFLASAKPYVCANPRGMETTTFLDENPSTGAAYLLGPDCAELPQILEEIRGGDPLADKRRALREYLLGPDEPPSIAKWREAVDALAATVEVRSGGRPFGIDDDALDEQDYADSAGARRSVSHLDT